MAAVAGMRGARGKPAETPSFEERALAALDGLSTADLRAVLTRNPTHFANLVALRATLHEQVHGAGLASSPRGAQAPLDAEAVRGMLEARLAAAGEEEEEAREPEPDPPLPPER